MVRGYHEYQKAWDVPIGEILSCEDLEVDNIHDTFAGNNHNDYKAGMAKDRIAAGCPYFRNFPILNFSAGDKFVYPTMSVTSHDRGIELSSLPTHALACRGNH